MLSTCDHDAFVAGLYSAAMGDRPWLAQLEQVANLFGASASLIQVSDSAGIPASVTSFGYTPKFQAEFFASDTYRDDPRVPYYRSVRPGQIYYDHALYDVEAMARDPRCRASYDILNVEFQLGAVVSLPNLGSAALTILRSPKEGHASEEAIAAFRRLAPHIEQAISLGHILEHKSASQAALLEALSRKADGVMLLSRAGAPTFLNDTAAAILAAGDGLAFHAGAFVTRRGPETLRLHRLVTDAIAAASGDDRRPGGQMLVTRPSGLRPYVLRVSAAPRVDQFLSVQSSACVIHIHDLAATPQPSKEALAAVFGLSERETDLAIELVRCANLAHAATAAGMAVNTARNHLQSIFRKSGVASQAEAVLLFSRLL